MKNKAFSKILVLIILVVLTGGGFFAWQNLKVPKGEIKVPEEEIRKEDVSEEVGVLEDRCETVQYRDTCYNNLAKETNDESWCEKKSEDWMIDNCYEFFAEQRQDEAICEKMKRETSKNGCYRDIALVKNDETICENITTKWTKTYCYIQIAEKRNEDTVCDSLVSETEIDDCYKRFAQDQISIDSCGKINYSEAKDDCYLWFVLGQRNLSICEEIEDFLRKENCKSYFIFDTSDWEIYTNTEYGFQFKIPPLFVQTGYNIEEKEAQSIWFENDCGVIRFNLHPIKPYYGTTANEEDFYLMAPLYICSKEYCQNLKGSQFCQAVREGRMETEDGDVTFCDFVAENEKFIIYEQGGPSSGDSVASLGWDTEEIQKIKYQMLSTFKFLD